MVVVERFFLNNFFKSVKLLHSTAVCAKALLKELASSTAAFDLDKIHCVALVWLPADKLVDDLASEVNTLAR